MSRSSVELVRMEGVVVAADAGAVVVAADGSRRLLQVGDSVYPGDLVFTGGTPLIIDFGDDPVTVAADCATCVDGASGTLIAASAETLDVDALQQAILAGVDPTQAFEAAAAGPGGGAGGSGGSSFIVITRDGAATLAQAGFDSSAQTLTEPVRGDDVVRGLAPIEPAPQPNSPPTASDLNLTVNEDEAVSGAIVASDLDGDSLNYVLGTGPTNGSVILNADGTFTYTPNANYNGSDSFTVTVSDGQGGTVTSTVTIGVTPVNDAPTTSNVSLTTAEDTPVNGAVTGADLDGDTLSFALGTGPTNGSVVLNADGTFTYTPNANYNGSDSFTVTVSDGQGGTVTSTVTIGVTPVNDAPTTSNVSLTTAEDTSVNGAVTGADLDGDTLSFALGTGPTNGSVILNADGTFTYTPNANYNGSDSFTVTVSDGQGGTVTSTVTIGVAPVNDAPTTSNVSLTTAEDTSVNGAVTGADLDGDTLSFALGTGPTNGSVILNADGTFTYTPNANYNGSDSFTVTVSDGQGGTVTSTVTIGVTPVNDAPVTSDLNLTTDEDTPVNGAIVASDVDGDSLSYVLGTGPTNGSVTLNADGTFTYTPSANYNGSDSFTVTVSDGQGGTVTSTVTIGVTPVNDAPVTSDLSLTTDEDTPVNGAIVASDLDGDPLGYALATGPTNGAVVLNPTTGTFVYTPNANYNGSDSFTVTVSDGQGGTVTSTVTIGVTPVNDAPVTSDLNLTTDEDTPVNGAIVASDLDGDPLGYALATGPTHGAVVLNPTTGTFVYTPNANYNGSDSFTVTVSDGEGGTVTSTVTIGVTPVNDAPVTSDLSLTTDEDTPVNGAIVASDLDGDPLGYALATGPTHGAVILNPTTGTFVYTPNANYNGSDSFTVTVSDGEGGTVTSTVTIGVTPVNDAPVTSDLSLTTDEDTPVNGAIVASDLDGDPLGYALATGPTHGAVALNPTTGTFVYTPNANYNGSDSFTVTVADGKGGTATSVVQIAVNEIDVPSVMVPEVVTLAEDTSAAGNVLANDSDVDDLLAITSYEVNGTSRAAGTSTLIPGIGEFRLLANGDYEFTPQANYHGPVPVVTYTTNTGASSTLTLTVTPVNDSPNAVDDSFTIDEDQPLVISPATLLGNDFDIDGDSLTLITLQSAINGTLSVVGGNVIFTPTANYSGPASFRYSISDGKGGFDSATVNITVNAVNDPSVMNPEVVSLAEDTSAAGNVLANDSDVDDLLAITSYEVNGTSRAAGASTLIPGVGEFRLLANGDYEFTPQANYHGPVPVVTYTTNTGASSTLTLTVTPVNDSPDAVDDNFTINEDQPLVISPATLLANDSDIDGDTLSVSTIFSITNGTVGIVGGNIIFTPTPGYSGPASFRYSISDGKGGFDSATVNITVNAVDNAPVAVDDSFTVLEDGSVIIDVLANDSDVDSPGLTITAVNGASISEGGAAVAVANGSVSLVAGQLVFTPSANYHGPASFNYSVSDGTSTVTATVTGTVTPLNDAPVATNLNLTTAEDTPVNGTVVASDVDGDSLGYLVSSAPAHGTVVLDPATGSFVYTPGANYHGNDSFVVTVSDGKGGTATSTVTIGVTPVNDAPQVATGQLFGYSENMPAGAVIAQVAASDVDSSVTAFRFADTGTNLSADGWFQISNSGVITLTAAGAASAANDFESGSNSHSYAIQAGDAAGAWSPAVNVTLQELDRNDAAGLKGEYWAYEQTLGMTPKDGPNLTNVAQVEAFMASRAASATFVATTINYGQVGGNLGADGKLQAFLGADAGSLSNDPVNSSDAMIRLTGQIDLVAGQYEFRVRADDGFSIRIDGVVVAEVNGNQSPTTTTFPSFTISESGAHTIEIIYWDQAGNAVLQPEIRPVGGTYQPLGGLMLQQTEDNLVGTSGQDQLYAGMGNDRLLGGAGADTFIWKEGDEGTAAKPAADRVGDFSVADGDRLDLSDLLQGESVATIDQFLSVAFSGDDTVLSVRTTAGGSVTQSITLEGWSQSDWQSAYGDASLDASNLVQKLIDDGKLQIS